MAQPQDQQPLHDHDQKYLKEFAIRQSIKKLNTMANRSHIDIITLVEILNSTSELGKEFKREFIDEQ